VIMKKDEIKEKLRELGVTFDNKMTKDELKELLDETLAKAEKPKNMWLFTISKICRIRASSTLEGIFIPGTKTKMSLKKELMS